MLAYLQDADLRLVDTLAILHRVAAGVVAVVGLLGVPAIVLLLHLASLDAPSGDGTPSPGTIFRLYGLAATGIVVVHLALALVLWSAGGALRKRRHWAALVALQAILLTIVPHGTALGVFGLFVLLKPPIRATFP